MMCGQDLPISNRRTHTNLKSAFSFTKIKDLKRDMPPKKQPVNRSVAMSQCAAWHSKQSIIIELEMHFLRCYNQIRLGVTQYRSYFAMVIVCTFRSAGAQTSIAVLSSFCDVNPVFLLGPFFFSLFSHGTATRATMFSRSVFTVAHDDTERREKCTSMEMHFSVM